MQRRRHKKSRNGCVFCKQRHIKCDERRPSCVQCELASQRCIYTKSSTTINAHSASGTPSRSNSHNVLQQRVSSSSRSPGSKAATIVQRPALTPPSITGIEHVSMPQVSGTPQVNVLHLQLFHHISSPNGLLSEAYTHNDVLGTLSSNIIDLALQHPFLMTQLLVFSAFHLSTIQPEHESIWGTQAADLQSSAIALFNRAQHPFQGDTLVAALLFASFLGSQVLGRVLAFETATFHSMIDGMTEFLKVQLGVKAVIGTRWEDLLETDFREMLTRFSLNRASPENLGACSSLAPLTTMIIVSALDEAYKLEYQATVTSLTYCFSGDAKVNPEAISVWPTTLKAPFTTDLVKQQPEALVILANYAVLLHWHRNSWIFGDGGRTVIKLISQHLGSPWARWLEFPLSQIEDD